MVHWEDEEVSFLEKLRYNSKFMQRYNEWTLTLQTTRTTGARLEFLPLVKKLIGD
jgi:hypothetical protein